jgi:hypothetical protein
MYRVDITADLNDEDDTGYVWTSGSCPVWSRTTGLWWNGRSPADCPFCAHGNQGRHLGVSNVDAAQLAETRAIAPSPRCRTRSTCTPGCPGSGQVRQHSARFDHAQHQVSRPQS